MLTKVGKILAILTSGGIMLGAAGRAYYDDILINKHEQQLNAERQSHNDDHYMICYIFQQVQEKGVPASCNTALRVQ